VSQGNDRESALVLRLKGPRDARVQLKLMAARLLHQVRAVAERGVDAALGEAKPNNA
jgi:hypothetical protein